MTAHPIHSNITLTGISGKEEDLSEDRGQTKWRNAESSERTGSQSLWNRSASTTTYYRTLGHAYHTCDGRSQISTPTMNKSSRLAHDNNTSSLPTTNYNPHAHTLLVRLLLSVQTAKQIYSYSEFWRGLGQASHLISFTIGVLCLSFSMGLLLPWNGSSQWDKFAHNIHCTSKRLPLKLFLCNMSLLLYLFSA